jgi:PPOX class probable F420-dependent enzyme
VGQWITYLFRFVAAMTSDEARQFLAAGTRTAKLATTRKDGRPHVVPIWFVLDGDEVVFTTGRDTVKGRNIRRTGQAALCVDLDEPPFAFVKVEGTVTWEDNPDGMLDWATRIAERYMGADRADAYGRRNAVPGELLVRLRPASVVGEADVAGW